MCNWRKIFSWNISIDNLEVDDRVRIIADRKMLFKIGVPSGVAEGLSGQIGTVVRVYENALWYGIKSNGEDLLGDVQIEVDKTGQIWKFPFSVWQDYLEIVNE